MIIGKSLTALGGGGLKPEIHVTAKAGALLNLHFKDSSIILQTYQLGESETQHTFVVSVSETAYVVEDVTNSASVEVLVDAVAVYNVEIEYKYYLYRDGDECEDVTGGWVDKANNSSYGYFKKQSNYLEMGCSSASYYYEMGVSKNMDISGYTKAYVDLQFFSGSYSLASYSRGGFRIGGKSTTFSYGSHSGIDNQNLSTNRTVLELDISSATETHPSSQAIVNLGANGQIKVYRIWLE